MNSWQKKTVLTSVILSLVFFLFNRGGIPMVSHLVFVFLVALIALIAVIGHKKEQDKSMGLAEIFLICFLAFFLLSFFFSKVKPYGALEFFLYSGGVVLILIIGRMDFSVKFLGYFKTALVFTALAESLGGIFVYTRYAFPRFTGTFIDLAMPSVGFANVYANFQLLLIPLCLEKYFSAQKAGEKTLYGLISGVVLTGFLLSFSRGAWMAGAVALVSWGVFAFSSAVKNRKQSIIPFLGKAVILVFLSVLIVFTVQSFRSKIFPTTTFFEKAVFKSDEGASSVTNRFDFWDGSLKMILKNPVFGTGSYSFRFIYPSYQKEFGAVADHPHNWLLKIAVENGLAAVLFLILFLSVFAWKYLRAGYEKVKYTIPFAVGALASFGHNLTDYNFVASNFLLFSVFVGISMSVIQGKESHLRYIFKRSGKVSVLTACFAGIILLLAMAVHEGYYNFYFKKGKSALARENFSIAREFLEKSKNLFWERDLSHYLSEIYGKLGDTTLELAVLSKQESRMPADASAVNRSGEILLSIGEAKSAKDKFEKALLSDPVNRIRYHYNLYSVLDEKEHAEKRQNFRSLLKEYEEALKRNAHLTVLTDNPEYAVRSFADFSDIGFEGDALRLQEIWLGEIIKYVRQYGPIPKTPVL